MVHTNKRNVIQLAECSRYERANLQGCAHSGALREGDNIEVAEPEASLLDSLAQDADHPLAVVTSSVTGEESLSWRGDIGVSDVREDGDESTVLRRRVTDNTGAELVRAALETETEQPPCCGQFPVGSMAAVSRTHMAWSTGTPSWLLASLLWRLSRREFQVANF